MIDKVSWIFAGLIALVLAGLAFVYGKKTPDVLRARARAHNAKGRVLNAEIAAAEKEAAAEKDELKRQVHVERANMLKVDRDEVKKRRLRLLEETGDINGKSDAELAELRNAASRSSSVAG